MVVSSYGGANTTSTGLVKIVKDLDQDLSGKDVLIVEDILDTGVTLSHLVPMLKLRRPNSVRLCTILSKPSRRKVDIEPDYCGFEVPDEFVVGYGLDYDGKVPQPAVCRRVKTGSIFQIKFCLGRITNRPPFWRILTGS